ncbi:TIGR02452 family protein [Butyrivibrio sp. AE2032]|uniref:TIGR02452 family protein n=1 Tax=Butyrivibrio sp. AE2032 TaxID=1458463 RepID=UPI000550C39F|nr:TIGR02452 family protein [Butyrivibrio sp. AE2032]
MADRIERIKIFENTLEMCDENERLSQSVSRAIINQKIYWEDDALQFESGKPFKETELWLTSKRSCEAAKEYLNNPGSNGVCVLNFASFVTPGGGVVRGTTAQEESMCRISTLYRCISDETVKAFYESHKEKISNKEVNRRNNDDIIFTPGVTVFKADTFDCELLADNEWYEIDIITCAAPDLRQSYDDSEYAPTYQELLEVHKKRWRRILSVAFLNQERVVILGAFGCGAFYNPPQIVAQAAEQVCEEFDGMFEKIVFAVYTKNYESENYTAFSRIKGIKEL